MRQDKLTLIGGSLAAGFLLLGAFWSNSLVLGICLFLCQLLALILISRNEKHRRSTVVFATIFASSWFFLYCAISWNHLNFTDIFAARALLVTATFLPIV